MLKVIRYKRIVGCGLDGAESGTGSSGKIILGGQLIFGFLKRRVIWRSEKLSAFHERL